MNELERREAHYLKRASESEQRAASAIDLGEHLAWKRIAATWRSLATQAKDAAELLGEINSQSSPATAEALESVG